MKNIFFLIFIQLLSTNKVLSQPTINALLADSLKQELKFAKNDTSKVLILEQLTRCYTSINSDSALLFGRQGIALASKIKYINGKIACAASLGFILARTNDYAEGLKILLEAQQLCEKFNKPTDLVRILTNLSNIYDLQKDYTTALNYAYKAKNLQESYHISEGINPMSLALGVIYKDIGNKDSAIFYLKKAYTVSIDLQNPAFLTSSTYYLGGTYAKYADYNQALEYYQKSLFYAHQFKTYYTIARVYQAMAQMYVAKNQLDSAIFYSKKALEEKENTVYHLTTTINAATLLSQVYEKKNNPTEALKYYKIAIATRDSSLEREKVKQFEKLSFEEQEREAITQRRIAAHDLAVKNQIKIYALLGLLIGLSFFAFFLYRNNQRKHNTNILLSSQKEEISQKSLQLEKSLSALKQTQNQLIQKEKLASLGELTAGIAHEIQNPLNFVNNFSELSVDLAKDLNDEIHKPDIDKEYVEELLMDLTSNQEKINHHGKRASSIVKGMLEHSRASTGERELTDINALADEYLRLSYHGMRAKDKNFNADYKTDFDENLPRINVIPQDIGRVLLNLINNAFYAVKAPQPPKGESFTPSVIVSTQRADNQIIITVKDNGNGIPENIKAKIFQPFFTTKPTGEGTGLGLSLAYDIVTKGHGGELKVETKEGEGSIFQILLPI